jgi:hypothetical protein
MVTLLRPREDEMLASDRRQDAGALPQCAAQRASDTLARTHAVATLPRDVDQPSCDEEASVGHSTMAPRVIDGRLIGMTRKALKLASNASATVHRCVATCAGPVDSAGEQGLRRALHAVRLRQAEEGVLDEVPEAIVALVAMVELWRQHDVRLTKVLCQSPRVQHELPLPRRALSSDLVSFIVGVVETVVHPVLGAMGRLSITTLNGQSRRRLVLCEWPPESLSFAADYMRVDGTDARADTDAGSELLTLRLAIEATEALRGRLSDPDAVVLAAYDGYVTRKGQELIRRSDLFEL